MNVRPSKAEARAMVDEFVRLAKAAGHTVKFGGEPGYSDVGVLIHGYVAACTLERSVGYSFIVEPSVRVSGTGTFRGRKLKFTKGEVPNVLSKVEALCKEAAAAEEAERARNRLKDDRWKRARALAEQLSGHGYDAIWGDGRVCLSLESAEKLVAVLEARAE